MPNYDNDITNCLKVLKSGGIILYPTDTVWGLGCDATNESAVNKIFHLKQRPDNKSLIVLLAEARDVIKYVASPHPDIISIVEDFDRPTTVIYSGALFMAANAIGEDDTVAIRVINESFCKSLIKRFGKPIVSTSANISGQPTPAIFSQIHDEIKHGVDYIVQYRQDDDSIARPSRIVKVLEDGELEVIRP